ncbi:MAG: ISL3 family transposase [Candidatus Saccharimonadales bacterium]
MEDRTKFLEKLLGLTPDWEVKEVRVDKEIGEIDVFVEFKHKQAICPISGEKSRVYDLGKTRRWRHLNIMQYKTYINCRVPRVINEEGRISTIEVPWSDYSDRYTYLFEAEVIKVLQMTKNQTKTATYLGISYDIVNRVMKNAVDRGLAGRKLDEVPEIIGLDEKSFLRGHDYVTVLTDITNGRVLDIERDRTIKAGEKVLDKTFAAEQLTQIKVVTSDMSDAYLNVGRNKLPHATQVADRFHLMKMLGDALDKTRKQELRHEKALLTNSKFALLKRQGNLTDNQKIIFKAIDMANLRTARVWRARENFRALFNQPNRPHSIIALTVWLSDVSTLTLYHLTRVAETFKKNFFPVCNALWNNASNAMAERLNGGIQQLKSISRGYRNFDNFRAAILFHYGKLSVYRSQNFL